MEVFRKLENDRIIVIRAIGYTSSDCREEAEEIYDERGGPRSGFLGFCYIHRQDVDLALDTGEL